MVSDRQTPTRIDTGSIHVCKDEGPSTMNESTFPSIDGFDGKQEAARLASYILHKHYCENDVDALIELLDDDDECFSWFGAAEHEYAIGSSSVAAIFDEFRGKVLPCNITDEHFDVIEPASGVYLVSGTYWVATDPSAKACIRVHQRTTMGFRIRGGSLKCFHIHLSNPYTEMVPDDVGFPTHMSAQSYEYLQERLAEQAHILEEQSAELASIYATAPCSIMRLLRTESGYEPAFINPATARIIGISDEELQGLDWSNGYCELLVEEDAQMARSLMASLKNPGDRVEMVCKLRRPSGEIVYISSNNEFIGRDERGDIIQKIVFDISDRIELEQALEKQSFEDSLAGMFNRNKFNQQLSDGHNSSFDHLGIAYFDINGLKRTNDLHGHRSGDDLIRRAADIIMSCFEGKAYRIGGDEFVIIDAESDRKLFESGISRVCRSMKAHHISIAVGLSFREKHCNVEEQFDEADKNMHEAKGQYYRVHPGDREKR